MIQKILSTYKKLPVQIKASFWFLMCSVLQRGISVITTPIFTRILTTTEYGQFSVFSSWEQMLMPIITLNLCYGVYSQGVIKFDEDRDKYSSSLQGLTLTLVIGWMIVYLVFRDFWNNLFSMNTTQMLSMFIIIWTTVTFTFWSMEQRVDFKYNKLVALTLIVAIIQPIVGILMITHARDKVTARILGIALVHFIFYAGTFFIQMSKGKTFFSKKYWLYALKFNIPLLPHYLSLMVLSSSDRIMIGTMVGNDKAGIYNLAYSLSFMMNIVNTALLQTIEPWIYKKLKASEANEIANIAYTSFLTIAIVNLPLIMMAPEVISIFAPIEYKEAIWIIPPVVLSVYFMFLYTFFATFEFYFEKTNYVAGATLGGAVLNIVLNYFCIKRFGYIAAGYTTLFSYILFAILHYYFMCKICKQYLDDIHPYDVRIIIGISLAILIVGFVFLMTYTMPMVRYSLIGLFAVIVLIMRKKIINMIKVFANIRKEKIKEV